MKKPLSFLLLLFPFLFACSHPDATDKDKTNTEQTTAPKIDISGEWTSYSLYVNINSENGGQLNEVLEVTPENYEEEMQYKPSKLLLKTDGSYEEIFRDLQDSLIYNASGHWIQEKDSLFLYQQTPKEGFFAYYMQLKGDTLYEKSWIDWDADGIKDDLFKGKYIKE